MALINCPDCGKEVSNKAFACIHCGCPLQLSPKSVKIKMPLYSSTIFIKNKKYAILDSNNNTLWSGEIGKIAEFELDTPTEIKIKFLWGIGPKAIKLGIVKPGKTYQVSQDAVYGYNLSEIQIIDSI